MAYIRYSSSGQLYMDSLTPLAAFLAERYIIERELGGGGMSRVFVATDTALSRQVVVKVLPTEMAASVSIERFKREIMLAARLQHPHIVPVLAAGETDGLPWFIMPFVDGADLDRLVGRAWLGPAEAEGRGMRRDQI